MMTLAMQNAPTPRDGRRWREALHRYVPITAWLPAYPRDLLRGDLIAGVTSWGVMVPVAMAYAQMAGVPAQVGLYTAFAALLGYAIFGTSRQLKVTTSSTMAVMSAAVVGVMAQGDVARYVALSSALAFTVGIILLTAGIVRLGFISDFLSKSVITGFVFGLALGILSVSIFHLEQYGVSVVGQIPAGLRAPGLPHVGLSALPDLATGAVGIVFLAVGESLGSARTQLSSIVTSVLIVITELVLAPLFCNVPNSTS